MMDYDYTNVLSSQYGAADPSTPLFTSPAGMPVRIRIVEPAGHPRNGAFTLSGHSWVPYPWTAAPGGLGSEVQTADPGPQNRRRLDQRYRPWPSRQRADRACGRRREACRRFPLQNALGFAFGGGHGASCAFTRPICAAPKPAAHGRSPTRIRVCGKSAANGRTRRCARVPSDLRRVLPTASLLSPFRPRWDRTRSTGSGSSVFAGHEYSEFIALLEDLTARNGALPQSPASASVFDPDTGTASLVLRPEALSEASEEGDLPTAGTSLRAVLTLSDAGRPVVGQRVRGLDAAAPERAGRA